MHSLSRVSISSINMNMKHMFNLNQFEAIKNSGKTIINKKPILLVMHININFLCNREKY